MRVYLELIVRELASQRVKKIIQLKPTMSTEGHFMNVILEYEDKRQVYYPLNKEEYKEFDKKYNK